MDMTRLSASTFPLLDRGLDETLAVIAAAGFGKVDLIGKLPHLSLDSSECPPGAVRACAAGRGVRIANLATYVGAEFASADEAEQRQAWDQVCRAVDLAAFLGARSIRGFRGPDYDNAADIPRIAPWIRRAADYAAKRRVYLGLENHGGGLSGVPEACRELAERVGSPRFGVIYDPCNLHTRGCDYREALNVMRNHVVHVHLKDGTSEYGSQKRTMLGEGEIDVRWIMRRLDEIGYAGDITLEYEVETVPPEEGLKQWHAAFVRLAAG